MELVGFDTHILIWGVQKTSRQTQQDMIPKTERFFKHLDGVRSFKDDDTKFN